MSGFRKSVFWLMLLGLSMSFPAKAESVKFAIGMQDYPPFYYRQEGVHHGILPDIFSHMNKISVKYIETPRKRIDQHLMDGRVEMVLAHPAYLKNSEYLEFVPLGFQQANMLFSLSENQKRFESLEILKDVSICARHGFVYLNLDDRWSSQNLYRENSSSENSMMKMLEHGRCEFMVSSKDAMLFKLKHQPSSPIVPTSIVVNQQDRYLAVHKRLDDFINEMQNTLNELHESGEMQKILHRYQ